MSYAILAMGVWILQDGLASIAYYPKESWKWNHASRIIRSCIGVALIVIGVYVA